MNSKYGPLRPHILVRSSSELLCGKLFYQRYLSSFVGLILIFLDTNTNTTTSNSSSSGSICSGVLLFYSRTKEETNFQAGEAEDRWREALLCDTLILILILTLPLVTVAVVVVLVVGCPAVSVLPLKEETKCSSRGGGGSVWRHAWL